MTETNCDVFTHNQSRSYLNHLVLCPKVCWEHFTAWLPRLVYLFLLGIKIFEVVAGLHIYIRERVEFQYFVKMVESYLHGSRH